MNRRRFMSATCAGATIATLIAGRTPVDAVAFSPDGKILASAGADNNVKLWDQPTVASG